MKKSLTPYRGFIAVSFAKFFRFLCIVLLTIVQEKKVDAQQQQQYKQNEQPPKTLNHWEKNNDIWTGTKWGVIKPINGVTAL